MTTDPSEVSLLEALPRLHALILSNAGLHETGLTKTQLIIIIALLRQAMLNMTQVSKYISASREQATRAVDGLVHLGYVERLRSDENRTYVLVKLTQKGLAVAEKSMDLYRNSVSEVLSEKLSSQEISELREAFSVVNRLLNRIL